MAKEIFKSESQPMFGVKSLWLFQGKLLIEDRIVSRLYGSKVFQLYNTALTMFKK